LNREKDKSQKISDYLSRLIYLKSVPWRGFNSFGTWEVITKASSIANSKHSKQQTANSKQQTQQTQQTANSKQQTANSKQQTANSKQQTANSKQQSVQAL
jgi:hypothetical protein